MAIKTAYFGEVDVPDGGLSLMDGGIHGVQGHTITFVPGSAAEWRRRVDGVSPSGRVGGGSFVFEDLYGNQFDLIAPKVG